MASSVDLPQPDGPEMDRYSPLRMFNSIPAKAWVSTSSVVNTLETLVSEMRVRSSVVTAAPFAYHLDVRFSSQLGSKNMTTDFPAFLFPAGAANSGDFASPLVPIQ